MANEDISRGNAGEIRFITYLSPGIPLEFFETVAEHARRVLGLGRVSLLVETRFSGPKKGVRDPFSAGDADVGFMCAPSYVWLRELRPPPVELLGVVPVFEDERSLGRPVYFCDVVVRRDGPIQSFAELEGGSWAYNDTCSLSGYYSLLEKLTQLAADESYFEEMLCSGSHLNSIEAVASGEVDAAAIDSNVLRIRLREMPALREQLRVIESWGPFPIQPVVVRSTLHPEVKEGLRAAFLSMQENPRTRRLLDKFDLSRFVAVSQEDYSPAVLAFESHEGKGGAARCS